MHLIITHPNADFDAIASLVATHRLYPEATPILPYTLNRNVRDFITLHENQFAFRKANELGREPITRLTLVDTQHIPTLNHVVENPLLHIIDHHDLNPNIPPEAVLSLTDTGANITLLLEQLRGLPGRLSPRLTPIEATLYLLGIYEDTGSLTYANTTPRDLMAAAWLLAEGRAQLDLAREYLYYPMSAEQVTLYNRLINALQTHHIHGQTIMVAAVTVDHYISEISTVAYQLRELYNPAALFLLVEMEDSTDTQVIQLVARSTTNAVDVGKVAEQLGGGGHQRAAAASIKHKTLTELLQTLSQLLPVMVQPAITVAQIMSRGVKTLAPNDTIRHAVRMIDRYGHEGFPVVETDTERIVGILSRREVDKAQRHKLEGAAISQFMTKGEFFVAPRDGLETVRQVMIEQQIGQVPVVEPASQQLIGIVTRTDLINQRQLLEDEATQQSLNLATALAQRLSSEVLSLLSQAGQLAIEQGDNLYIVGGFTRDLLLTMQAIPNKQTKTSPRFDLDLVVEGHAISLAERLRKMYGGRIYSHQRFGTAKWLLPEPIPFNADGTIMLFALDFVTARTEFYRHPSALPEVEQSSIRHDLHRRDFTINTLALCLTPTNFGELLDFYNGQVDLEAGLIRVLHSLSFIEDPTRMLRAARLMARLDFTLETRTAELLTNALDLLERVSAERLLHELELIFKEQRPSQALLKLAELGILTTIHPALLVDAWLVERLNRLTETKRNQTLHATPWVKIEPQFIHYFGLICFRLSASACTDLLTRLNLTVHDQKIIIQSHTIGSQTEMIATASKASTLYNLLVTTTTEARLIAWLCIDDVTTRHQLIRFEETLRHVKSMLNGHHLKQDFNIPPGPVYGVILDKLRQARLDGLVQTIEDERALAQVVWTQMKPEK